ncbi:MAG: hypothetical protein Q9218_007567, partial [Villophora microphyllina]
QWYANKDKRLLAFQQPYIDQLGPTFEISLLGALGYNTLDPENVEAMLSSRFDDFCVGNRRGAMFPFIGEGIFTQDGPAWKHSRDLLRRPFLKTHYQDLKGFYEPTNNLLSVLSSSFGVVDLQPLFFQYTLATTTSLIFGQPVESSEHNGKDSFGTLFDHASWITTLRSRLADFYWTYNPSHYKDACNSIKEFADGFVRRALSTDVKDATGESSSRYAFIEDLYAELKDPILVRDQLINVLLAGRDTTACLLSWTFHRPRISLQSTASKFLLLRNSVRMPVNWHAEVGWVVTLFRALLFNRWTGLPTDTSLPLLTGFNSFLLVRHPRVLSHLQSEINAVIGPKTSITKEHIQKMTYLRHVLSETLRLYPPLPLNARFANKTTWLPRGGGSDGKSPILIPKGLGVVVPSYYLHRRKDIYGGDAMEFRPERWEGEKLANVGWGYLPFHGGPRLCLGKDFALTEASYMIIRILQEFPGIKLPKDDQGYPTGQEKQELTIFLKSADGCKVVVQ